MAVILIAEDEYWQPGLDFAAAMRYRGHTSIRLTADSPEAARRGGLRRWSSVATCTLNAAVTEEGLPSAVGLAEIDAVRPMDWQAAESVLNWLSRHGYEQRLSFERSTGLPPHDVQDKQAFTRFLEQQGLAVPLTWDSIEVIPDDVCGPFMFKLREQGGGIGIERCEDRAALVACASMYEGQAYIVQRFHTATPTVAAGIAKAGKPVQMMTYTSLLDPRRPFAMAYGLRVVENAAVYRYAEDVLAVLGITGPFALDTVPGVNGDPLALDMNLRIWGSWTACQAVGMDVLSSYEHAIGVGTHPGPLRLESEYAPILRRPPLGVRSVSERTTWLAAESAEIRRRASWLGWRWARCSLGDSGGWAIRGPSL